MAFVVRDINEFAVHGVGIFGRKMAVFSAVKRTNIEDSHFDIYLYNNPEDQVVPTGHLSLSETQVAPMLALIGARRNFQICSEAGKLLTFTGDSCEFAIYNTRQHKKPSAFIKLPLQEVAELCQKSNQAEFFRILELRMLPPSV